MVVNGAAKPRLHIMFDVPSTPELARNFPERYHRNKREREAARWLAIGAFSIHERFSADGRKALGFREQRDVETKKTRDGAPN
jgi:hypothetical protein